MMKIKLVLERTNKYLPRGMIFDLYIRFSSSITRIVAASLSPIFCSSAATNWSCKFSSCVCGIYNTRGIIIIL